jgi:hypothetical protein
MATLVGRGRGPQRRELLQRLGWQDSQVTLPEAPLP